MTLEQLKYMRAIVEQGSFRAAAEHVYKSQSSLSISIKKLETELGFELFTRDSYRPILTESGTAMYQKALALLKKDREFQSLADHLSSGSEAELKLAISGIVPIEPIIHVLNQVSAIYPETRMTLHLENLGGTMERIFDDDADIAITDSFEPTSDFESNTITQVQFVTVVPTDSVWAKQAATITQQDLEEETLIVVRDTSRHSPRLSKGLFDGAHQWVVNDFATKQRIIRSGKGWGRMPLHLVKKDIEEGHLTELCTADFQSIRAPISIVRKKSRPQGPVEQLLWQSLQSIPWE
ncbi:MAG: LysR family transcriptional regulator [Ghiorsea sp.]